MTTPLSIDPRSPDQEFRELARDVASAAYLRGDFVLSSGSRSSYYFDKYLFETKPGILRRVCSRIVRMLPEGIDRLAGPELGAVALATGVSLESGLPFVIVRRNSKRYGTSRFVEGELYAGESVLILEDVVSSGAQAIKAGQRVEDAGARVAGIVSVIDRQQGGSDNILRAGFNYSSVFVKSDFDGVI